MAKPNESSYFSAAWLVESAYLGSRSTGEPQKALFRWDAIVAAGLALGVLFLFVPLCCGKSHGMIDLADKLVRFVSR